MTWLFRYHVRNYVRSSLWLPPLFGMLAALAAARLLHHVDVELLSRWTKADPSWKPALDPDTARAVLGTLASSTFTFVVFVCSALLVAVQLASAQLTPRIIALVFEERGTRAALSLFTFAFTFCLAALLRVNESVPTLTASVAGYASLASLAVFLYLIDRVGRFVRPSGAVRMVARLGREVIHNVYPRPFGEGEAPSGKEGAPAADPVVTIPNAADGVVLAFDAEGLVALARQADCVIELAPQVGDFVAAGDPLFRVHQSTGAAVRAERLAASVAVGQERTMEQDPAFAFRILVDVASKGLSPAINDPTTAVLAIDQIHHLLRQVGGRQLDDGRARDADGKLRLIYRTPDWEDFVQLAVTEIRQFGGTSIQVARRLRAMLENLLQTLPEARAPLLRQELSLLARSAERAFPEPEDRALADVSDLQGVGGNPGAPRGPVK
jgi:uncharacterized membrane protein